ncbi:MAG: hypothetical protein VW266_02515, partial [Flavobacteriales bacterium]
FQYFSFWQYNSCYTKIVIAVSDSIGVWPLFYEELQHALKNAPEAQISFAYCDSFATFVVNLNPCDEKFV